MDSFFDNIITLSDLYYVAIPFDVDAGLCAIVPRLLIDDDDGTAIEQSSEPRPCHDSHLGDTSLGAA